jgi:hypothetical protein
MLGWEYPPFYNGGLGLASQGLAEALAAQTDLTLVLPRGRLPEGRNTPLFYLLSLHGSALPPLRERVQEAFAQVRTGLNVKQIDLPLTPYESFPRSLWQLEPWQQTIWEEHSYEVETRPAGEFRVTELYGSGLGERVQHYAELVMSNCQGMEFDLIHAHDWMTFPAALALQAASGKPLVLHVHSLEYDRGGPDSRGWIYELEKAALARADRVVAVSEYTAQVLAEHYGLSLSAVRVVGNGIEALRSYRTPLPYRGELVVYLGRLSPQKGPEYLFEAALKLLKKRPGLRFAFAGKGELIDTLIHRAAEEKVGDRLLFTGFLERDRALELLSMADVYVMPSVSEPFGLAAAEAAQMGVPCVITRQSGAAEVLRGALTYDYWDTARLAAHIQALLESPALRREVLERQALDLRALSWEAAAEKMMAVYGELRR